MHSHIHGYVHSISTDAHSAGRRRPLMTESYHYIKAMIGDGVEDLYRNNGMKVIQNEAIMTDEPEEIKRGFFQRRRT